MQQQIRDPMLKVLQELKDSGTYLYIKRNFLENPTF